jgi:hypothetical protein
MPEWSTIKIWTVTHPKLRLLAAMENITMGELIDRLAQKELDRHEAERRAVDAKEEHGGGKRG